METLTSSVGYQDDPNLHQQLHRLEERGAVERIYLPESQIGRRRFRATSDADNEYGVVLDRDPGQIDGLVLLLEPARAVVLHRGTPDVLRLSAATIEGGIQLGWHAGHLHWRVKFEGDALLVHLDSARADYVDRIRRFLDDGSIEIVG